MVTADEYLNEIMRKCTALGVWRDEFERTAQRLARVYERIDKVEDEFERTGGNAIITHTNKAKEKNLVRNPFLVEVDALYDQALTYERELGLTAAALRKINENALKTRRTDGGLATVLRLLES